jgi:hypothetical protein
VPAVDLRLEAHIPRRVIDACAIARVRRFSQVSSEAVLIARASEGIKPGRRGHTPNMLIRIGSAIRSSAGG